MAGRLASPLASALAFALASALADLPQRISQWVMRQHLATLVQDLERHNRQIATVSYPGNRRVATSYAELAHLAGRFSRLLLESGIGQGERILLWGGNCAPWVAAFFGAVLRGVIAVPLDAAGNLEFALQVISDVTPSLIVGDRELLEQLPSGLRRIAFQEFSSALPSEPMPLPEPSLNPDTPLQILYTSGTTSQPKGIVHTHGNVLASLAVLEREIDRYRKYERWVHPLRILHTLPLSHVFGQFMGLWVPPLLGAPVHYEDKLIPAHLVRRIRQERISVAAVVPRVLELMAHDLMAADPQLEPRLASMQNRPAWERWWRLRDVHRKFGFKFWAFVSGGAALPEAIETFWTTLGFVLIQGYGMTETTALATLNHPLRTSRGSIGRPLPGREVRVAEDGEILVRGPVLAAGTWRHGHVVPRAEDWLHTGDLGRVDAEGRLYFTGRKSDTIVAASGLNIHPEDLEAALRLQPGVRDCVVVGWQGPHGPAPVAVVQMDEAPARHGDAPDDRLRQAIAGANRSLRDFQQISAGLLWPIAEFPRNSMGKLLRRQVAAWAQQQLDAAPSVPAPVHTQDPLLRVLQQVTQTGIGDAADTAELAGELRLDSLARMQLAMAIEDDMGILVDEQALSAARTLGDLRQLIEASRLAAASVRMRQHPVHDPPADAAPRAMAERHGGSRSQQSGPGQVLNYPHWPWSWPVQALRVGFVEGLLRPLVALLAHPAVDCDARVLPSQPAIYIVNHVTAMDVPLVLYALPPRVRRRMAVAMSAELLAAWKRRRNAAGVGPGPLRLLAPLQAWAVTALFNVFPLPAGQGLRNSFAHAGEALDRGYNLLIFPEGQRTPDGALQRFQPGISLLAQQSNTVVVPIALVGLWQAARQRSWRSAGLRIVVGKPLAKGPAESHEEFTARLRQAVSHPMHE